MFITFMRSSGAKRVSVNPANITFMEEVTTRETRIYFNGFDISSCISVVGSLTEVIEKLTQP